MRIEFVTGAPEYGEYRDRGWYAVDRSTGECDGPYASRRDAEAAAGRPDDDEED
ncbi:hypothetical protein JRF84_25115 [Methylobacterium organophilum]|uniref:hypothetical protein n=1 Tax=Methylobacterium organophilum TaxID=410 RepID=UPI0019D0F688|nr:hypothetical protein [Methylobacterium organophilum]MBN6822848.1 hypothetical protein [Methylobacterium organophilum]